MNKAAIAGIIAAIVIGIGVALAFTIDFSQEGATSEIEEQNQEETKDFKITLKEDLGIQGEP